MFHYYLTLSGIMVSSPDGLVEEMLGGIGDAIGERIDHKWWSKYLYPIFVMAIISIPVIYYFY